MRAFLIESNLVRGKIGLSTIKGLSISWKHKHSCLTLNTILFILSFTLWIKRSCMDLKQKTRWHLYWCMTSLQFRQLRVSWFSRFLAKPAFLLFFIISWKNCFGTEHCSDINYMIHINSQVWLYGKYRHFLYGSSKEGRILNCHDTWTLLLKKPLGPLFYTRMKTSW